MMTDSCTEGASVLSGIAILALDVWGIGSGRKVFTDGVRSALHVALGTVSAGLVLVASLAPIPHCYAVTLALVAFVCLGCYISYDFGKSIWFARNASGNKIDKLRTTNFFSSIREISIGIVFALATCGFLLLYRKTRE